MSNINKHITIPKHVDTKNDQDFQFLKEKGIEYIESLSGQLWTDYNEHDPGITMLELLSYAITDLGMRIDMPIENILSSSALGEGISDQFYKASEVFPTKSVTALDYQKLFIDTKLVKNCWLSKFEKTVFVDCKDDLLSYDATEFTDVLPEFKKEFILNGLYNLHVDYDLDILNDLGWDQSQAEAEIRKIYHQNRNLCEDLINISTLEIQRVNICTNIEVHPKADEELVKAKIIIAIEEYFSPTVRFYSIKEMLDKGYTTDEIFEGPLLEHGFIDTQELREAKLRSEVRLSDIINLIMSVDGVKIIKDISIGNCDGSELENEWVICIDDNMKPKLCDNSIFNFFKDVLPLNVNPVRFEAHLAALREEELIDEAEAANNKTLTIPTGNYFDSEWYSSIQNDMPDTYGVSQAGLVGRPDVERKAKAKQLKAYLLFFDQILAGYFKHLGKVKELLSVNGSLSDSYFTQVIQDIAGIDDIVTDYSLHNDGSLTDLLFSQQDNAIDRRNQILDHLLARFAENFGEYSFLMKTLYESAAGDIVMRSKEAFLADYQSASTIRGCGFNYWHQYDPDIIPIDDTTLWNTDNISGFQKRIGRLMGVKNYNRRDLSSSYVSIFDTDPPNGVYAWIIDGGNDNVIENQFSNFGSYNLARNSLYSTALQVIQTTKLEVENAFEGTVTTGTVIGGFGIEIIGADFGFVIINEDAEVIAKHNIFVSSLDDLKAAILELIRFMKEDFTEEGMFLVEHIILRPNVFTDVNSTNGTFMPICTDNCESCEPIDPYSYRVSIVLPGYTFRFMDAGFRTYMENQIRMELPSQIMAKICWVGHRQGEVDDVDNDLMCFENSYYNYLIKKSLMNQEQPDPELEALFHCFHKLNNLYPTGRLLDCENDEDDMDGTIILGRTNLGTL